MAPPQKKEAALTALNVTVPAVPEEGRLVQKDQVTELGAEILKELRLDRQDADDAFGNFYDMVINQGDASTSSKEAMVRLLELRMGISDKKTKVLELLLKTFQKEQEGPKSITANQHNEFVFDKRKMIEMMDSVDIQLASTQILPSGEAEKVK